MLRFFLQDAAPANAANEMSVASYSAGHVLNV